MSCHKNSESAVFSLRIATVLRSTNLSHQLRNLRHRCADGGLPLSFHRAIYHERLLAGTLSKPAALFDFNKVSFFAHCTYAGSRLAHCSNYDLAKFCGTPGWKCAIRLRIEAARRLRPLSSSPSADGKPLRRFHFPRIHRTLAIYRLFVFDVACIRHDVVVGAT